MITKDHEMQTETKQQKLEMSQKKQNLILGAYFFFFLKSFPKPLSNSGE